MIAVRTLLVTASAALALSACSGGGGSTTFSSHAGAPASKSTAISWSDVQSHQKVKAKNDDAKAFAALNKGGSCSAIVKGVAYWYKPKTDGTGTTVCVNKDTALKSKGGIVFHLDGDTWKRDKAATK